MKRILTTLPLLCLFACDAERTDPTPPPQPDACTDERDAHESEVAELLAEIDRLRASPATSPRLSIALPDGEVDVGARVQPNMWVVKTWDGAEIHAAQFAVIAVVSAFIDDPHMNCSLTAYPSALQPKMVWGIGCSKYVEYAAFEYDLGTWLKNDAVKIQ